MSISKGDAEKTKLVELARYRMRAGWWGHHHRLARGIRELTRAAVFGGLLILVGGGFFAWQIVVVGVVFILAGLGVILLPPRDFHTRLGIAAARWKRRPFILQKDQPPTWVEEGAYRFVTNNPSGRLFTDSLHPTSTIFLVGKIGSQEFYLDEWTN